MGNFSEGVTELYDAEVEKYFPGKRGNWRLSEFLLPNNLPLQGWKIHISATPANALEILKNVGELVLKYHWQGKAIMSIELLRKMNTGLFFGYSQIGKFITIYCIDHVDFVEKISILKESTRTYTGPSVPSDMKVKDSSCLYYRYGNFQNSENTIVDPQGNIILDGRLRRTAVPLWAKNQTTSIHFNNEDNSISLLDHGYLIYECLSQRGKGGVFKALSVLSQSIDNVIIKEGRKNGEEEHPGRDGYARLLNEHKILNILKDTKAKVPKVIKKIETEYRCLVITSYIPGIRLDEMISESLRTKHNLSFGQMVRLAFLLSEQVGILHAMDIYHRDIKPANLIIDECAGISLIDFEGAHFGTESIYDPWGSPGFAPPEWRTIQNTDLIIKGDIYSIGATFFSLFTGSVYRSSSVKENDYHMSQLPTTLSTLIKKMLSTEPDQRPTLPIVLQSLEQMNPDKHPTRFLVSIIDKVQRRNLRKIGNNKLTVAVKNDTPFNHIIHIYDQHTTENHEVSGSPFSLSPGEISTPFEIYSIPNQYIGEVSILREGGLMLYDIKFNENMVYSLS
ncbi:protein kinase [Enterobacter sp. ECC-019]|uniref:class III lanthionine synthetase LanKC N-terminal domain-containing protein n=1 Tax=Enterobacter sp. ECC-019 TaxID=3116478 RepID=UPI0037546D68